MPYYNKDPKRDHNFDNHPYSGASGGCGSSEKGFSSGGTSSSTIGSRRGVSGGGDGGMAV